MPWRACWFAPAIAVRNSIHSSLDRVSRRNLTRAARPRGLRPDRTLRTTDRRPFRRAPRNSDHSGPRAVTAGLDSRRPLWLHRRRLCVRHCPSDVTGARGPVYRANARNPFRGILALLSTVTAITAAAGLLATLVLKSVAGLLGLSLAVGISSGFFLATLFIMDRWLDLRIVIRFKLVFSPLLRRAGVATR